MAPHPPVGELEQLVLLAILRLGTQAFGPHVARGLEQEAGRRLSRGALYTTLERLEVKGFIRWKTEAGGVDRKGLPRRVYSVTARGVAVLRTSHRVLRRMWTGLDDVLGEQP